MLLTGILLSSGGVIVTLSGETISHEDVAPIAGVHILGSTGKVAKQEGAVVTPIDTATDWGVPEAKAIALAAQFSVMLTVVSGDSPTDGDNIDEWLSLGTDRSWTARPLIGVDTGVWRLHISRDGGSTTIDTADYTVTATVS